MRWHFRALVWLAALTALATAAPMATAQRLTEDEAVKIATDAYVYGYPLVTMEMTRRVMTNVAAPEGTHAPMGQFVRMKEYPNASFKDVTAPNADTLYSTAWLDLSKEPYVFSLPNQGNRYFLMPMLSGWTDIFAVPGKRTTGDAAQTYAITGPTWRGNLPSGVKEIKSPTSMVWILGRTYCIGTPEDYRLVHALQDRYVLSPLSSFGRQFVLPKGTVDPKVDTKTPVREQVNRMSAGDYFKLLSTLMKNNPPAKDDAAMVESMAKLGIVPGKDFDISKLDPAVAQSLERVPKIGAEKIAGHMKTAGADLNGWVFSTKVGIYGTDYLQRATVAYFGLGANRPQDAVYPTSEVDGEGRPYSGANNYVLHFAKGETPPAKAFWSITMYNGDYFFVANPLNKYTVSPRNALKYNDDGSLDLYIQKDSPGADKEANWLPAPPDKFVLMMRMYWPSESAPSIIDGTWKPPAVKRLN